MRVATPPHTHETMLDGGNLSDVILDDIEAAAAVHTHTESDITDLHPHKPSFYPTGDGGTGTAFS